jgi:hypothetical protein
MAESSFDYAAENGTVDRTGTAFTVEGRRRAYISGVTRLSTNVNVRSGIYARHWTKVQLP